MHSVPDFKLEHTKTPSKPAFVVQKKKKRSQKAATQKETDFNKFWPPTGWPMFEGVYDAKAIATRKLEDLNVTQGASYEITLDSISPRQREYTLEIQEWSYDTTGQHKISTALRFKFKNCPCPLSKPEVRQDCISFLSLYGAERHPHSTNETTNFALVAAYLSSRIEKGYVPDIRRVLKLYKLI